MAMCQNLSPESSASISVQYWAAKEGAVKLADFDGIDEFRTEIAAEYAGIVKGRPAGLGGLYKLTVEIVSTFALGHLLRLLLDGVAYDLIKDGSQRFVLRPFMRAYEKLRIRNKHTHKRPDLEQLRLVFSDSIVVIDCLYRDSIFENVEPILRALADNYHLLRLESGEVPYEIHIPVFEDPAPDRPSRFRVLLDVDETIPHIGADDYYRYWGLWFDYFGRRRIFDVARKIILDASFLKRTEYWRVIEERWREKLDNAREIPE
jgi:hypothetical protein